MIDFPTVDGIVLSTQSTALTCSPLRRHHLVQRVDGKDSSNALTQAAPPGPTPPRRGGAGRASWPTPPRRGRAGRVWISSLQISRGQTAMPSARRPPPHNFPDPGCKGRMRWLGFLSGLHVDLYTCGKFGSSFKLRPTTTISATDILVLRLD